MDATTLPTLLLGGDPTRRAGRDVRRLAGRAGAAVGARAGRRPDPAVPGRRRRRRRRRHRRQLVRWHAVVGPRATCPPAAPAGARRTTSRSTPESAGWGYSGLRDRDARRRRRSPFDTGGTSDRAAAVRRRRGRGRRCAPRPDRPGDVFAGPTDSPTCRIGSTRRRCTRERGGRFALCGARTDAARCRSATDRPPTCRSSCAAPASPAARCTTSAPRTRLDAARSSPAR